METSSASLLSAALAARGIRTSSPVRSCMSEATCGAMRGRPSAQPGYRGACHRGGQGWTRWLIPAAAAPLAQRRLASLCCRARGRSSVVERQLPKLSVVGSIPIARSNKIKYLMHSGLYSCCNLRDKRSPCVSNVYRRSRQIRATWMRHSSMISQRSSAFPC